ncbi:hypothetical protein MT396_06225 [Paenibacillus polymyxa]|uniref:hypothetical protein n=2 Tax=Paenibacillus polymyxa TaxID=1406 RepID=UPI001FB3E0BB|nr:hypothetical protein [Paenibacillus polymyxa]MCJ1219622.1 hypothetical protein [Paenibacillus polymyxa]
MMDQILSDDEIKFLDNLLLDVTSSPNYKRSIDSLKNEWARIQNDDNKDFLEQLRIKGIIENSWIDYFKVQNEFGSENIIESTVEVCSINGEEFVKYWLKTLFYKSGRNIKDVDLSQLEKENNGYSIQIPIGSDSTKIYFVTKDSPDTDLIQYRREITYISFIGELSIPEESYAYWYDPIMETPAAVRFFAWLNENVKPIISKFYSYINIPTDLENSQKEDIFKIITLYLTLLSYKRRNSPDFFRPESIEYFFPENTIKDCFIKNDLDNEKKIFLVVNSSRVELHTFINGVKSYDENISFHSEKLQEWIDRKTTVFRKIGIKTKSTLLNEALKIVPIMGVVLVSAYTSLNILWSGTFLSNIQSSKPWLIGHISISILTVLTLAIVGILPHINAWFFSWDRNLKKYADKNARSLS